MRIVVWVLIIAGLNAFCCRVVVVTWTPHDQGVIFLLVALFATPSIGTLWMTYTAVRNEAKPVPFVVLAFFIPFSFLWYYFERHRAGRHLRRGSAQAGSG